MSMSEINITPIRNLITKLVRLETDPGEIHVCPLCKGILHVKMSGYTHKGQTKRFAAYVRCENCETFIISELDTPPPWIKEADKIEFTSIKDALQKLKEHEKDNK